MDYAAVKPFCHLYLSFVDDLLKVYTGKVSQEKLSTQRKWLLQGMLRKNTEIPEIFMKSILVYSTRVMQADPTLFDPTSESPLKLGRLDWKIFSKETDYTTLTHTDKESLFKYLRSMLLTCQMLTGRMSMEQFSAYLQQSQAPSQQQQQTVTTTPQHPQQQGGADPLQAFLSNPAYAQLYANMERQLATEAQRSGIDMNNKAELMSMVLSGKLDMSSIMRDMSADLDAQIQSGAVNKEDLEAQANGIIASMSGGLPPGLMSTLQSNPSMLMSMLGGQQ